MDSARINPASLWTDAKHMRVAAEVLISAVEVKRLINPSEKLLETQLMLPTLLLVSSSIEAGLKSFLLYSGITLSRLKSREFGHDLVKLLNEVSKFSNNCPGNPPLSEVVSAGKPMITALNCYYMDKVFSYRRIGWVKIPEPKALCKWSEFYLGAIKPVVNPPQSGKSAS